MHYESEIDGNRLPRLVPAMLLAVMLGALPARADVQRFSLAVPDGQTATYRVAFEVAHAGDLTLSVTWDGPRQLSFKFQPPEAGRPPLRRYGGSPLTLTVPITDDGGRIGSWELQVHALAGHGALEALVTVERPEPSPPPGIEPTPTTADPELEAPERPSWWTPPPRPAGTLDGERARLFEAVDRLRAELKREPARVDSCRWQDDLMRDLDGRLESATRDRTGPSGATARVLAEIAGTVREVDGLRRSDDPLIAGPPPADPQLERTWEQMRASRILPVEDRIDRALDLLRREHADELADLDWPIRLVSCIAASERHFEEVPRIGEDRATNRDLALAQWPRILLAADALEALAALGPDAIDASARNRDR